MQSHFRDISPIPKSESVVKKPPLKAPKIPAASKDLDKASMKEDSQDIDFSNHHPSAFESNGSTSKEEEEEEKEVQKAIKKLENFPLSNLRITKKGEFDKRMNLTKEYLLLCSSAKMDPNDYYEANKKKEVKEEEISKQKVETKEKSTKNSEGFQLHHTKNGEIDLRYKDHKIIAAKIAEAKEKLSKFDTSGLKKTKDGNLDMRYKINKEYLQLQKECEESYYENMNF